MRGTRTLLMIRAKLRSRQSRERGGHENTMTLGSILHGTRTLLMIETKQRSRRERVRGTGKLTLGSLLGGTRTRP